MSTLITAPRWIQSFYSLFPLVQLEQEHHHPHSSQSSPQLWILPSSSTSRPWASADPDCLRIQLLFLLRGANLSFRPWSNPSAAPKSTLPALHLPAENLLLSTDEIRQHLDDRYPLSKLQGMPDQATYDRAIAVAQLVLGRIRPDSKTSHLELPVPPVLAAGLATPLPASLTGDSRASNEDLLHHRRDDAWESLRAVVMSEWALGASKPTQLDALIAAYIFTLRTSLLPHDVLLQYADRVLDAAEASL